MGKSYIEREIGQRIKALRKESGISQTFLGERLRRDQTTISDLERGKTGLTGLMSQTICRYFGVREAWLVTGEGPKEDPLVEDSVRRLGDQLYAETIKAAASDIIETLVDRMIDKGVHFGLDDYAEMQEILSKVAELCVDKQTRRGLATLLGLPPASETVAALKKAAITEGTSEKIMKDWKDELLSKILPRAIEKLQAETGEREVLQTPNREKEKIDK